MVRRAQARLVNGETRPPNKMTQSADIKDRIEAALRDIPDSDDTRLAAENLLNEMGYESELVPAFEYEDAEEFVYKQPATNPGTQSERDFLENAVTANLVFQVTDDEIARSSSDQLDMFGSGGAFSDSNAASFMFAAVDLEGDSYPRGRYAAFSREINKRFQMPMCALFRTASDKVTLSFAHRRRSKVDRNRHVIGNISLIREIDPADPHRAHLDILEELSLDERLEWMKARGKSRNFDGLLEAWLAALDTEELNKKFYKELFEWFQNAVKTARFPTGEAVALSAEEHVMRLITRMLFVWFVKEKGLVDGDLFIENRVSKLLADYDGENGDSYYRAVLQNLFFATLNTEIGKRDFSKANDTGHRDFSKFRYRDLMADPDALIRMFARTPFINGGLFDCLDSFDAQGSGGYRIDCFSDNPRHRRKISVPNRLFFGKGGLIPLFEGYKFTVEENTPTETEVALDPELLGKAFENLLAANTPETRESARKQTGSYYTPRPVVDYMVDEALTAAVSRKASPTTATGDADADAAANGDDSDRKFQDRLRRLFDYADPFEDNPFDDAESEAVVRAVSQVKILDPAVGSGAFPMGVLHKLTLALRRLDPDNKLWEAVQRERAGERARAAFDTNDPKDRDDELAQISETFERYRDSDYGRKLYLAQNSVFGVDIQPIAAQIAKLRFFISLAIEQNPSADAEDNYGIKPLPNLETRFVAANTLVGLDVGGLPAGGALTSSRVRALQREMSRNRERYFHATTRTSKFRYRREDESIRQRLAATLKSIGMTNESAEKIAVLDPYDQNAFSDWFDPQYMFGVPDGFDIVIGNPPYVRSEAGDANREMRDSIVASGLYETLHEKWDLYIPFIERGYQLLSPGGFTSLIVSDAYCHARYARKSQDYFLRNARIAQIDFLSQIKVFEAGVHNVTYLFQKADGTTSKPKRRVHYPEVGNFSELSTDEQRNLTHRAFFPEDALSLNFSCATIPLSEICYVSYGLRPSSKKGASERFVTSDVTRDAKDEIHSRPYVDGKHLDRWLPATNLWIEWGTDRSPWQFYAPTFTELHDASEKILLRKNTGKIPVACYDNQQFAFSASVIGAVPWNSLSRVMNRSIKKQAMYSGETNLRGLPSRENLENTSKRFGILFLLGVLNSSVIAAVLRANRRHNLSIYPDDWKALPIPDVDVESQAPVIELVERILSAKGSDSSSDTSVWEGELDALVYGLYGLSESERAAVAGG